MSARPGPAVPADIAAAREGLAKSSAAFDAELMRLAQAFADLARAARAAARAAHGLPEEIHTHGPNKLAEQAYESCLSG